MSYLFLAAINVIVRARPVTPAIFSLCFLTCFFLLPLFCVKFPAPYPTFFISFISCWSSLMTCSISNCTASSVVALTAWAWVGVLRHLNPCQSNLCDFQLPAEHYHARTSLPIKLGKPSCLYDGRHLIAWIFPKLSLTRDVLPRSAL